MFQHAGAQHRCADNTSHLKNKTCQYIDALWLIVAKKIYEEGMKHWTYHGETTQDNIMKHVQSFYPTLTLAGISIHVQSCYPTVAPAGINIHLIICDK
jgi:hypothetical protein